MLLQNWGAIAVIVGGYLLGIYFQNRSIAHLDKRIDDQGKRFDDVNKRIDDLRDTLRSDMRAMKAEILMELEKQANRKLVP
jgi:cell division protein FtsL